MWAHDRGEWKEPPRCTEIPAAYQKTNLMIRITYDRNSRQQRFRKVEESLPVAVIECRWLIEGFLFIGRENAHPGHKADPVGDDRKGTDCGQGSRTCP